MKKDVEGDMGKCVGVWGRYGGMLGYVRAGKGRCGKRCGEVLGEKISVSGEVRGDVGRGMEKRRERFGKEGKEVC